MNYSICLLSLVFSYSLHAGLQQYKGVSAYKKGDFATAQQQLQQALINDPHDAQLLYNNGDVAYRLKEYDAAARYFEKAVAASDPKDRVYQDSLYNLGTSYAQQEKLQDALQTFNKLLRHNPHHERAVHNKKAVEQMLRKKEQEQQQEQKNDSKPQQEKQKSDKKDRDKSDKQDRSERDQQEQGEHDQQKGESDSQQGDQQQKSGKQERDGNQTKNERTDTDHENPSKKPGQTEQQEKTESGQKDSSGQSQEKLEGQDKKNVDQNNADSKGGEAQQRGKHKNPSGLDNKKKGTAGEKKAQQNKEPLYATQPALQESEEDKKQPEYQLLKALDQAEQEVGKDLFKTMTKAHMKGHDGQKNW